MRILIELAECGALDSVNFLKVGADLLVDMVLHFVAPSRADMVQRLPCNSLRKKKVTLNDFAALVMGNNPGNWDRGFRVHKSKHLNLDVHEVLLVSHDPDRFGGGRFEYRLPSIDAA